MDWTSLACCLLAFLLYYNTLDAGFVYDDRRAILSNPDLLPSTPWWNLLENDFWGTPLTDSGSHGSFRPLCVFTFRLNYLLGGFQPWGYHLVNVLLHCLATALVVRVARALLPPAKTKLGSAIAGLTFASHPIHTEAVAGVVGRADLAACNFYLLSFLVYVAHVKYRDTTPYPNVTVNHLPYGACCIPRCSRIINGVTGTKKTYRKPTRRSANGTSNGHVLSNGYSGDNDLISQRNSPFLYSTESLNYHNILFHLIDSIKKCNWFGKVEDFGAAGGIICALKFFLSCGINTWQVKKANCTNINNNNINGDVKSSCHVESKSNGIVGTGLLNGSVCHSGAYNGVVVNGSVKCNGDDSKLSEGMCKKQSDEVGLVQKPCWRCRGSGSWGWKRHSALVGCVLFAAAATLSKETGVTALAACALYDLVRAAQDATWNNKRRLVSLGMLFAALVALLAIRVPLSATPKFARADNPTARDPSMATRTFTFYYLPVFNFFLLICPSTLSFDWSMDAVPRITSLLDPRNILSIIFYIVISKTLYRSALAVYQQGQNKSKTTSNSYIRKDNNNKIHSYGYPKNGTNGSRCVKVNRNGIIYQFNNICSYNSVMKSGQVLISAGRLNGKTVCACPCCRQVLTDHHSTSCRAVNNNNSMTTHSTCTCPPYVSLASVPRPPVEKVRTSHGRRNSHSAMLLAASFLTMPFLPATNLFFYVGFVVAERVLYLPSVGFSLLVGLGGAKVGAKLSGRVRVVALGALLIALSARTLSRNRDWRDEESLYRSAVGVNPPKAFGNLGSVLSSLGRLQEAEIAFHEALRHRPNMADVHYNLGVLLQGRRQYEDAIQSFERAIHFRPSLALAYVNMGASLAAVGRCSEAASVLSRGSRLDGTGLRDGRAHAAARSAALQHLGTLHAAQGRPRRALAAYQQALQARPPDYRPQKLYSLMSEALGRLQRWAEAEKYRRAALEDPIPPTGPARTLRPARGRVKHAEKQYKWALLSNSISENECHLRTLVSCEVRKQYGILLAAKSLEVKSARRRLRTIIRIHQQSTRFSEPDMLISKCRTTETPKSCCT